MTSLEACDTTQVLNKAEKALQALTTMLSTTDFFYGSEPTAIDAKVTYKRVCCCCEEFEGIEARRLRVLRRGG